MRSLVLALALLTACEAEEPAEEPTPAPEPILAPTMDVAHAGPLTDLSQEAIATTPAWLHDDLFFI